MTIAFNHTIVHSRDRQESAHFFATLFGLPEPVQAGPFLAVALDHHASLDFAESDADVTPQHYAFLVSEKEFDEIYARILAWRLEHWPDPHRSESGTINHNDGGRGVYFLDPSGHFLEILTVPYGGWPRT